MKIKLNKLKCERCKYKWIPRKEEIRICPKCKSPYWDKKKNVKKKLIKEKGYRG